MLPVWCISAVWRILLAVIVAGQLGGVGSGCRRWIDLPVIGRFQPSEFVKIGLIFFFSWFLQKNQEKINRPVRCW